MIFTCSLRIIPAHAGSTAFVSSTDPIFRDHPRSRGEHILTYFRRILALGSSPLTRGALDAAGAAASSTGIIPAHAGSTR